MLLQAFLIGLIIFIGKADYFVGTAMLGRPLVLGSLVGLALGSPADGVAIGFSLELSFMGMQAIGASIPPDMIVGSVLGTAFAITTEGGVGTAITIAFPAAVLSAFIVNLFYGVITPIMARYADKCADDNNPKGISHVFLTNGFLFDLSFAVIGFAAFMFGGNAVSDVVALIPDVITKGLTIATGILPALGFAQLLNMVVSKKLACFFFLGFLLNAYSSIPIIGVVSFALVLIVILFTVSDFLPQTLITAKGDDKDDNEF